MSKEVYSKALISKKQVMTVAWDLKRSTDENVTFSSCLKAAWEICKTENLDYYHIQGFSVTYYYNRQTCSSSVNLDQYNPYNLNGSVKQIKWATDILENLEFNIMSSVKQYKKLDIQVNHKNKFFMSYPEKLLANYQYFLENVGNDSSVIIYNRYRYTFDKIDKITKSELSKMNIVG